MLATAPGLALAPGPDSDPIPSGPRRATHVGVGMATAHPADGSRIAALAYVPPDAAGHARGALFALAEEAPAARREGPGAPPALQYLTEAFYGSICRNAGNALESAVGAGVAHRRALARNGRRVADVDLAAVAIQDGALWLAGTQACAAYVLRGADGAWRSLTAPVVAGPSRPDVALHLAAPIPLQAGDLVLLVSPGLRARVPEVVLRQSVLALVRSDAAIPEQELAEIVLGLAAERPGAGEPAALVVRCRDVVPRDAAGTGDGPNSDHLVRTLPAEFARNIAGLERLAAAGPGAHGASAPAAASPAPAGPLPSPGEAIAEPPALPARRRGHAPEFQPAVWAATAQRVAHEALGPEGWVTAAPRLAQLCLPAVGLFLGGGLMAALETGNPAFVVGGTSLSLLMAGTAALPYGGMSGRLALAGGAGLLGRDVWAPPPARRARPYVPPPRPAAAPLQRASGDLHWIKDRLVLPPTGVAKAGCLDVVNIKDPTGRIAAQVVLLCPARLLDGTGGHPGGIYVMLHDLGSGQRRIVAWLAPGERRVDAARQDVADIGGSPAALRWLRGPGDFELASSRLRVQLRIDRCQFVDPVHKQQLDALEIVLTDVQALP